MAILLSAFATLCFGGCGESSKAVASHAQAGQVLLAGEVRVLVAEPADAGMDALSGGGALEEVGGCLGAGGFVIVWPHGTEIVKDDPLKISVPKYGTFVLGDEVQIGGGFVLEHSSESVKQGDYEVAGVTVPAECAAYDIFAGY